MFFYFFSNNIVADCSFNTISIITRSTFCEMCYLPHNQVHNDQTLPKNFLVIWPLKKVILHIFHYAQYGHISTSGLKSEVTIVFLNPVSY